ncbi:MAG: hypothetical protein K2F79_06895 [Muribaculaceae bacterium]|nr:hypothetical protein [Muribaculaceae bacterium]
MGIISSIKRAFGFGYDDEDEIESVLTDDDHSDAAERVRSDSGTDVADSDSLQALPMPERPVIDPRMKAKIFDDVIAVFNASLPDFIARSVDADRQKQLLMEAIDKDTDQYLDSLLDQAAAYADASLSRQSENARREAEKLRTDMQQLEQQRTSLREQQLSADRRRRALADRVADLEAQLEKAEAEREQFELENKSLLNKIKVADIQPGVVEELQREIERLRSQTPAPDPAADQAGLAALREECDKACKERDKALADLELANNQLRDQHGISQVMYSDLQARFAAESEARIEAENALAAEREAKDAAVSELDQIKEAVASLDQIQEQMGQIEDVIRKRDEKIARLKASNKKLKDQIAELKNSLSRRASASRDEGLFALPCDDELTPEHRKIASELAAIEDDFECPDWFVAEPAPIPDRPDLSEFGYVEPPRKKRPDNDAQLSLF